jgi:hypothetical protein
MYHSKQDEVGGGHSRPDMVAGRGGGGEEDRENHAHKERDTEEE